MPPLVSMTVSITDNDRFYRDLLGQLQAKETHVDIGVHPVSGEEMVKIASTHEFGARISHPGGQPYIIVDARKRSGKQTRAQRSSFSPLGDGKEIIFLKKGKKGMGVTKPHEINIPMRSFIRSSFDEQRSKYERMAQREVNAILDGRKSMKDALVVMGSEVESDVKTKIVTLRDPKNADETIRRKGSDNPLIDTGSMLNSIRYVVKTKDDQAV